MSNQLPKYLSHDRGMGKAMEIFNAILALPPPTCDEEAEGAMFACIELGVIALIKGDSFSSSQARRIACKAVEFIKEELRKDNANGSKETS